MCLLTGWLTCWATWLGLGGLAAVIGRCAAGTVALRYWARPPFALERLSVRRSADGRIDCVRYVLPRHKAANWVGPGRGRKSTRTGASGVVELTPFEFLDRLACSWPAHRLGRARAGP